MECGWRRLCLRDGCRNTAFSTYLCKTRPTPKRVSRVPRLLKNTGAEGLDGWACCSINFWRRLAEGCSFPRSPVNNVELKTPAKAAGAAEGRSTQHYWALNDPYVKFHIRVGIGQAQRALAS